MLEKKSYTIVTLEKKNFYLKRFGKNYYGLFLIRRNDGKKIEFPHLQTSSSIFILLSFFLVKQKVEFI